ncbi:hypothetical protein B0T26DRAFT_218043 [Lasiosphaeria miniovina]|uniref:Uncharacterized protein n=1 Tax=Lasiosphaeria miniovina TaxID=1954250 RepID=A0AA40E359_9PEZI|nr:uncharacterized protein B0T26DRAFT_218043 [Lasiosphaeria miniovina]KAK0722406.1 hypothetical protein B0T26DRAFT_218043 [Lasiosphaeria miniovina]
MTRQCRSTSIFPLTTTTHISFAVSTLLKFTWTNWCSSLIVHFTSLLRKVFHFQKLRIAKTAKGEQNSRTPELAHESPVQEQDPNVVEIPDPAWTRQPIQQYRSFQIHSSGAAQIQQPLPDLSEIPNLALTQPSTAQSSTSSDATHIQEQEPDVIDIPNPVLTQPHIRQSFASFVSVADSANIEQPPSDFSSQTRAIAFTASPKRHRLNSPSQTRAITSIVSLEQPPPNSASQNHIMTSNASPEQPTLNSPSQGRNMASSVSLEQHPLNYSSQSRAVASYASPEQPPLNSASRGRIIASNVSTEQRPLISSSQSRTMASYVSTEQQSTHPPPQRSPRARTASPIRQVQAFVGPMLSGAIKRKRDWDIFNENPVQIIEVPDNANIRYTINIKNKVTHMNLADPSVYYHTDTAVSIGIFTVIKSGLEAAGFSPIFQMANTHGPAGLCIHNEVQWKESVRSLYFPPRTNYFIVDVFI